MDTTIPKEFAAAFEALRSVERFLCLLRQERRFHSQLPLALLRLARGFGFEPSAETLVVVVLCGFQSWRVASALVALERERRQRRGYIYTDHGLLTFGADDFRPRVGAHDGFGMFGPPALPPPTTYGSPANNFAPSLPPSSPPTPALPAMPEPSFDAPRPPPSYVTR